MPDFEPTLVDPTTRPVSSLTLPDTLDLSFEGFTEETFALLGRLRQHPHIEQYRKEKEGGRLERVLKAPFKRYRDDLVVNWVLPNRLQYETEKHVFSRLLKNDFGAGGCHHHKWLAFYRPGYRRLTDLQLSHRIDPDGVKVGLFVGKYGEALLGQAQARIEAAPERFLRLLNPLLEDGWRFSYERSAGERVHHEAPLEAVPEPVQTAKGIWIRCQFAREDVLRWGPRLVEHALEAVMAVWPIYRFWGDEGKAA